MLARILFSFFEYGTDNEDASILGAVISYTRRAGFDAWDVSREPLSRARASVMDGPGIALGLLMMPRPAGLCRCDVDAASELREFAADAAALREG